MKWVLLYEDFKVKNITEEDIIQCIKDGGKLWAEIVDDFPENDKEEPLDPASIDEEGNITCLYDGKEYNVKLRNVKRIS